MQPEAWAFRWPHTAIWWLFEFLPFHFYCSKEYTGMIVPFLFFTIISLGPHNQFYKIKKSSTLFFWLIRNGLLSCSSTVGIGWTPKHCFLNKHDNAHPKCKSSQVRAKWYSDNTMVTFMRFLITSSTFLPLTGSFKMDWGVLETAQHQHHLEQGQAVVDCSVDMSRGENTVAMCNQCLARLIQLLEKAWPQQAGIR